MLTNWKIRETRLDRRRKKKREKRCERAARTSDERRLNTFLLFLLFPFLFLIWNYERSSNHPSSAFSLRSVIINFIINFDRRAAHSLTKRYIKILFAMSYLIQKFLHPQGWHRYVSKNNGITKENVEDTKNSKSTLLKKLINFLRAPIFSLNCK